MMKKKKKKDGKAGRIRRKGVGSGVKLWKAAPEGLEVTADT